MEKVKHQEKLHESFGNYVQEELNKQKIMGIINQETLRALCHMKSSYLSDIKHGKSDYALSFYLRVINALSKNIDIPEDSLEILIHGTLAMADIKVERIKILDDRISIWLDTSND